jgi:manganese/zinc/iron transport system permease protein
VNLAEHYNEIVVLAGASLLGLSAGVVGCFAVLRQRALLGDALGHATLPGLCLGYLIAGQRSMPALLAASLLTGLLSILVFSALRRFSRLREDTGIAIVLSVFYAVGIVGLNWINKRPNSSQAGLESFLFGKTSGMLFEDVMWIAGLAIVSIVVIALLLKELQVVAFDTEFARVQGWPTWTIDMILMLLIALAVVLGLPAVGALLVAALLVIPAAAARFWTNRLPTMLVLAGIFGAFAGAAGTVVSIPLSKAPTGPLIILAAAAVFAVSLVFGRARGLLIRNRRAVEIVPTDDNPRWGQFPPHAR